MNTNARLSDYRSRLLSLPANRPLLKEDLLTDSFLLHRSGAFEVYYSPHNEYIEPMAKLVIMGLTPGWTQMKTAYEAAVQGLAQGLSNEDICKKAKTAARFAGSMRRQLIAFLDELDLPAYIDVASSEELFQEEQKKLHTVSILRYPVFYRMRNYTGSSPQLLSSAFLADWARESIMQELEQLTEQPLIIPLGKAVESVLASLVEAGRIARERVLWGFPHPSGANGHRKSQFSQNKSSMSDMLRRYFKV